MQLKPEEISKVIRSQIKYYQNAIEQSETGTVLIVVWKVRCAFPALWRVCAPVRVWAWLCCGALIPRGSRTSSSPA